MLQIYGGARMPGSNVLLQQRNRDNPTGPMGTQHITYERLDERNRTRRPAFAVLVPGCACAVGLPSRGPFIFFQRYDRDQALAKLLNSTQTKVHHVSRLPARSSVRVAILALRC